MLGREAAACRKLASRARRRVGERRPSIVPQSAADRAFIDQFHRAAQSGDVASFARLLAEDVELIADGGGKVYAALRPIRGRDKVARFLAGLGAKFGAPREVRRLRLNGGDGVLIIERDGGFQAWSIDWNARGEMQTIYAVRNPDKLEHRRAAFADPA